MNAPENMCFICGDMAYHLHESHHLVPRRLNGSDRDENLVNLCSNCHSALEKLYNKAFYRRLSDQLRLGYSLNNRGQEIRDTDVEGDAPPKSTEALLSEEEFCQLSFRDKLSYAYDHPEWFSRSLSYSLRSAYNAGRTGNQSEEFVDDSTNEPEEDLSEMSIEERMIELGIYDESVEPTTSESAAK